MPINILSLNPVHKTLFESKSEVLYNHNLLNYRPLVYFNFRLSYQFSFNYIHFISASKPYTQAWFYHIPSLRMCQTLVLFGQKDLFFHLTLVLFHLTGKVLGCRSSGIEHARSKYFMVNVCCMVRLYIFLFYNVHD